MFKIIDSQTSEEADAQKIALHEEWARGLVYCDIEGFALTEHGDLVLLDECGSYRFCPQGRFRILGAAEQATTPDHLPTAQNKAGLDKHSR